LSSDGLFLASEYLFSFSCLLSTDVHALLLEWHDSELQDIAMNMLVKGMTSRGSILVRANAIVPYRIQDYSFSLATKRVRLENSKLHGEHCPGDSVQSGRLSELQEKFKPNPGLDGARKGLQSGLPQPSMSNFRVALAARFQHVPFKKLDFWQWNQSQQAY